MDALMVTVSRHVIRVENMVTTNSLEASEVDLNGAISNYLLVLTYFLHLSSPDYVNMIKRLCRKLLYMYSFYPQDDNLTNVYVYSIYRSTCIHVHVVTHV